MTILQEYDRNKCDPNQLLHSNITLHKSTQITKGIIPTAKNNHDQPKLQDVINTTFNMSDPIHQRDISQSTLVSIKFISYFNSHFYTSIVIVTHEPFAFTPRERGKYSQKGQGCIWTVVVLVSWNEMDFRERWEKEKTENHLLKNIPVRVHCGGGEEIRPFLDFTQLCDQTCGVRVDDVLLGQGGLSVLANSVQELKIGKEPIRFSLEG